jgi:NAD(P)-dependent dehydrogenase (short-subunit alcohol dehydrogenase family)
LLALTELLALEFTPRITVNAIAPGLILPPQGKDQQYLQGLASSVPLRRHGNVANITDAVLFLLQSDFLTGQVIFVDGGRHLMERNYGSHHYQ